MTREHEDTSILIADLGGGALQAEGCNSIYDNQSGGVTNQGNIKQIAEYNWWGQADDPAALIDGDIDYTPWLTSDPNR